MEDPLRQIRVEALELPKSAPGRRQDRPANVSGIDWSIDSGSAALVTGGRARERSLFLRVLAGFDSPAAGLIEFVCRSGRRYAASESGTIRMGYLPPPGEEAFVGTTVEQELNYCPAEKKEVLARLEEHFGFRFRSADRRSVWALSDGERRLLALASQAAARPDVWFLDEPLTLLDGKHAGAVLNYLARDIKRGATIIVSAGGAGPLLNWAGNILIFSKESEVLFRGKIEALPEEVAEKLAWSQPPARWLASANTREGGKSIAGLLEE